MHFYGFAETPNKDKRVYIFYQKADVDNNIKESTI